MEMAHPLSTRHLEQNDLLGPAEEATVMYGPDIVEYEKCKAIFESA